MKIIIAGWHLKHLHVGIGRYVRNLIEGIGRVDQDNEYEILVSDHSRRVSPWPNIRYRYIGFTNFKMRYWEQFAPLCVGPYDLLHFPYHSYVGIKRGKFVTTIHDVIPVLFPVRRSPWKGVFQRFLIPDPNKQIDHVVTVSNSSKSDIIEKLGVPENKISVVYQGVENERFRPPPVPQSDAIKNQSYILCVSGDSPNKNVQTLLHAYAKLPNSIRAHYKVVLVGEVRKNESAHLLIKNWI